MLHFRFKVTLMASYILPIGYLRHWSVKLCEAPRDTVQAVTHGWRMLE